MGKADKDHFLDAEGNVTTDENEAAFLLIREGQDIPKEMADKYGIGKVAQEGEQAAAEDSSESTVTEKAAKPSANKSKKPTENKGVK